MPNCQPIVDELATLEQSRSDYQADLQGASPGEKPALIAKIKAVNDKIAQKQKDLNACLGVAPPPPPPPPIVCPLSTTSVTITTSNPTFPSLTAALGPTLTFTGINHGQVTIDPITLTVGPIAIPSTPCMDLIKVSIAGVTGSFDPVIGDIDIPISLTLSHGLSGGVFNFCSLLPATPSTLMSRLTTGTLPSAVIGSISGVRLQKPTGAVTLVASGTFVGGVTQLAGTACDLKVAGILLCTPLP